MEWVHSLNKAIDYIEDNLFTEVYCEEIAEHIYISSYHFQRVFSLLTGMTVGEHIRNRRLSLAGLELTKSNIKVRYLSEKNKHYELFCCPNTLIGIRGKENG